MGVRLVAVGGAVNPTGKAMLAFYLASGGSDASIVVIPTASKSPRSAHKFASAFLGFGLKRSPTILPLWQRAQAQDSTLVMKALLGASGILILGGDLSYLMTTLYATRFHKHLREAAHAGVIVAGISAGAAALSSIVLLADAAATSPLPSPPRWLPGFGLTEEWILLPHFQQRERMRLLLSAVLYFAPRAGLGIDEDTAVLLETNRLHVFGSHRVTVVAVQSPLGKQQTYPQKPGIGQVKILRLRDGSTFAFADLPISSGVDTHLPGYLTQSVPFNPVANGRNLCR